LRWRNPAAAPSRHPRGHDFAFDLLSRTHARDLGGAGADALAAFEQFEKLAATPA
jgi:hypothetical protein